jgi:hypothetical protein
MGFYNPKIELNIFQAMLHVGAEAHKEGRDAEAEIEAIRQKGLRSRQGAYAPSGVFVPIVHPELEETAQRALDEGNLGGFFISARGNQYQPTLFMMNLVTLRERGLYERGLFQIVTTPETGSALPLETIKHLIAEADREKLQACGDPLPEGETFTLYRGVQHNGPVRTPKRASHGPALPRAPGGSRRGAVLTSRSCTARRSSGSMSRSTRTIAAKTSTSSSCRSRRSWSRLPRHRAIGK